MHDRPVLSRLRTTLRLSTAVICWLLVLVSICGGRATEGDTQPERGLLSIRTPPACRDSVDRGTHGSRGRRGGHGARSGRHFLRCPLVG